MNYISMLKKSIISLILMMLSLHTWAQVLIGVREVGPDVVVEIGGSFKIATSGRVEVERGGTIGNSIRGTETSNRVLFAQAGRSGFLPGYTWEGVLTSSPNGAKSFGGSTGSSPLSSDITGSLFSLVGAPIALSFGWNTLLSANTPPGPPSFYIDDTYNDGLIAGSFTVSNKKMSDIGLTNYGTFVFTFGSGENTETVTIILNNPGGGSESGPIADNKDLLGMIQAWSNSVNRTADVAMGRIQGRMDFLKRAEASGSKKTSSQGINVSLADQRLQHLFLEPAKSVKHDSGQAMLKAVHMSASAQSALEAAENEMLSQFAVARTDLLGTTSPTFESDSTISDWSWWTMGTIMVGKQGERPGSSGLKVHADYLTFGVDRPTDRFGVVGASIMLGQDETDVGSVGSKVSNNSYSIALYNAYPLSPTFTLRSIAGGTDFDFKTRRIDGNETLLGKRGAQQMFASVELRQDGFQLDLKNPVDLEWYVKADWVDTKLKQFAEEGGTFALLFETQKLKSQHVRLGLDAKTKFHGEHGPIVPYMGLEYASNLSPASNVDMRYVSETRMYRHVLQKAYDSQWTLGLGVDYYIGKLRLGLSYERKHQRNYGYLDVINLGLEGRF